jgi:hypothetical protein
MKSEPEEGFNGGFREVVLSVLEYEGWIIRRD